MTKMTTHAQLRAQGRGISPADIEAVLAWGCEVPVGGGAWGVTLSRRTAAEMAAEGAPRAWIDTLQRVAVVVAQDDAVVTVMRMGRPDRARRYRRGVK